MSTMDPVRGAISEQAADWYITQRTGTLDDSERAAFLDWLSASPLHVDEYLRIARLSQGLQDATRTPVVPVAKLLDVLRELPHNVTALDPAPVLKGPSRPRRSVADHWMRWGGLGAGLVAASVLLGLVLRPAAVQPEIYRTGHGEQSVHTLADGSVIRLNSDSAVVVRYTRRERIVELEHGEAMFGVAHEARPFRVAAGVTNILAVGTQFDVYRKPASSLVTVAEGTVAVFPERWRWPWSAEVPADAVRLPSGMSAYVDLSGRVASTEPADVTHKLAWLRHQIAFDHWPLGEVAAEFNRYGQTPIIIEDAAVGSLRVSGQFDINDLGSFVDYLKTLPHVVVTRSPKRILVQRSTASDLAPRRPH